MSTAARKKRKLIRRFGLDTKDNRLAEAHRFIHTEKQGTPFLERAIGPGADHKGNQRHSRTQQKRMMQLHLAANPPAQVDYVKNSKGEPLDLVEEQARIVKELIDEQPPTELDPKPWRLGRKRFTTGDVLEMASGNWHDNTTPNDLTLAPRKQYEQDTSKY